MAWTIDYTATARKQLSKLDRTTARRIDRYLTQRVAARTDPRELGKRVSGPLGDMWRYRVGVYRLIAEIEDGKLSILVVRIGHRRDVYKSMQQ